MKIMNMKKYFLLICLFTIAFSSCRKIVDDTAFDAAKQAVIDDQVIHDYFLLRGLPLPAKDPSGLYYEITNPGTGPHPTLSSNVSVGYTVYSIDDVEIDSFPSFYSALNERIEAWQIGLQKIGKGGSITLYVPSALGFADKGNSSVAPNTVVIYKINIQGFN
jgi:FKBP-type peptidyl-prolyl cis-trans isomerase FkpA